MSEVSSPESEPAEAQTVLLGPTAAITDNSSSTKPSRGIAASPAPDPTDPPHPSHPPPSGWEKSLPRPASRPAMKSHAEDVPVDGRLQAPTKQRSVAELAAQVMKDRSESTAAIATSPPPMEYSSPEALHQELPEETSSKMDSGELRDSSNVKEPEPEPDQQGGEKIYGDRRSLSNLARFYWSMLDRAYSLFCQRRLRECHDFILWNLEKAHVPLAVRCQLLQQLSLIVPIHLGLGYLDQAAEICQEMRRLVPSGAEQIDLTEEKNLRLQQRLIRAREATENDEDEEMIEEDESVDEDEEMAMDESDAIEAKEGQTEGQEESQGVQ